jgi:hypothetical protein
VDYRDWVRLPFADVRLGDPSPSEIWLAYNRLYQSRLDGIRTDYMGRRIGNQSTVLGVPPSPTCYATHLSILVGRVSSSSNPSAALPTSSDRRSITTISPTWGGPGGPIRRADPYYLILPPSDSRSGSSRKRGTWSSGFALSRTSRHHPFVSDPLHVYGPSPVAGSDLGSKPAIPLFVWFRQNIFASGGAISSQLWCAGSSSRGAHWFS